MNSFFLSLSRLMHHPNERDKNVIYFIVGFWRLRNVESALPLFAL